MSKIAIFELDSNLGTEEIKARLEGAKIPLEISELSETKRRDPRIGQSKKIEVYVRVYQSIEADAAVLEELKRIAAELLAVSDGELYYYRSSHAQEKDAQGEMISVDQITDVPPTLGDRQPKRYILRRG